MTTLTTIPTIDGPLDVEHDGSLSPNDLFEARNAMPTLSGSEKQVEWARTIRRDAMAEMSATVRGMNCPEARKATLFAAAEAAIKGQTSARWWIDNRHHAKGINGATIKDILRAELVKVTA